MDVVPYNESGCEIPSVLLPSLAGSEASLLCVFLAIEANHTAACKSLSVQLRQVSQEQPVCHRKQSASARAEEMDGSRGYTA